MPATTPRPYWRALHRTLHELCRFLDSLIPVIPPGRPTIISAREEYAVAGSKFVYTVKAPDLVAREDVVSLKLYVSLDGDQQPAIDVALGSTAEVEAIQDQAVALEFSAIDESGNESPHGPALSFTATDTVAPSAPGQPVILASREVFDDATPPIDSGGETPEPTPEPGPTP